jgi:hypothetical protein
MLDLEAEDGVDLIGVEWRRRGLRWPAMEDSGGRRWRIAMEDSGGRQWRIAVAGNGG